ARDLQRSRTWLIRDARLFLGDGAVIERGSVLIKDGKIAEVYTSSAPEPKTLKAEAVEAAGKTVLPGLIDTRVHLISPGALTRDPEDYKDIDGNFDRELAAYLFSGVIAVQSVGDPSEVAVKHQAAIR